MTDVHFWEELNEAWEQDGIRLLEHLWSPGTIQALSSTNPSVSPQFLASRAKGRLQYYLKKAGFRGKIFTRKVAIHSVGDCQIRIIENYIIDQVKKEDLVDQKFKDLLQRYTRQDPTIDLSKPTETHSGRYWYNLHLVFVVADRFRLRDEETISNLFEALKNESTTQGHKVAILSILPDHIHIALRGHIATSPQDSVDSIKEKTAQSMGMLSLWTPNYYAGTFGLYDMNVIRRKRAHSKR